MCPARHTWSIAQGIKHGAELSEPKIWGNELEKDGADWTATKCHFPMLSLWDARSVSECGAGNKLSNTRLGESESGPALRSRDGACDPHNVPVELLAVSAGWTRSAFDPRVMPPPSPRPH